MKRVALFLALILFPFSVMAMTPVSDSTLSDVTGQAGVNINADLEMDITIGTLAWGDSDGVTGAASQGYVGMTNFNITNLRIKARETDTYDDYSSSMEIKPITIDVATGTKAGVTGTTFVRIGLGSLQITLDGMSLGIELGATTGLGQMLGVVTLGAMEIYIDPDSYIDIYAHDGCGVNMELNVEIDQFSIAYVSWGDTDGLPDGTEGVTNGVGNWIDASTTAGYVGLNDLNIGGPITIAGTVAIDVVSLDADEGVWAGSGVDASLGYGACTIVHISFPTDFDINVTGPITGVVTLDADPDLASAAAGVLGDIYLSNFGVSIHEGSWVDIWAH